MEKRNGMLYPMMVIAAISVILFSIIGIATMTGFMPSALSERTAAADKKDPAAEVQAEKDALTLKEAETLRLAKELEAAKVDKEAEAARVARQAEAARIARQRETARADAARAIRQADAEKARADRPTYAPYGTAQRQPIITPERTVAATCDYCGVVDSIQAQEVKGNGSALGVIGGAVLGGVLGHQVGGGRGQDLATVAGAVGGGFAGNEIEKNVKKNTTYAIRVRMEDGTYRTVTQSTQPGVATGDRVRIENGVVVSRG